MKKLSLLLALSVLLFFISSCSQNQQGITSRAIEPIQGNPNLNLEGPFLASRIIDGDTLEINTGEKIRLSGINTPEIGECYYQEAKDKLLELTKDKLIYLEQDISNKDAYNRSLRYVYVNEALINSILVEQGYAKVYDKYKDDTKRYLQLKRIEDTAITNQLGVWNCTNKIKECLFVGSKNSKKYYKPDCKYAKRIKPENIVCYQSKEQVKELEKGEC